MTRTLITLLLLFSLAVTAQAAVRGEEISYKDADGTAMKGYFAWDDAKAGKRPGVLVVHEWWGHNEYARKRARALAEMGYAALAVDMYGEGRQAAHPEDAGKFSGEIRKNMPLARKRFEAARDYLAGREVTDGKRIAAIGYCFGGGIVLQMARDGVELAAVASFHGSLSTDDPAAPGAVKARVLAANGAADGFVPADQVAAFVKEMHAAGADFTFVNYPGAKHSWTNPEADELAARFKLPLAYNAAADKQSWKDLERFLADAFTR